MLWLDDTESGCISNNNNHNNFIGNSNQKKLIKTMNLIQ